MRRKVYLAWILALASPCLLSPALAQSNLDAGKSAAQIFADTCNACHRSAREIKRTSPGFLREHYTTGAREAAAMAAYLSAVGSDPRAVQQRKAPVLGAGRAPENGRPTVASAGTGPEAPTGSAALQGRQEGSIPDQNTPVARVRRPSADIEIGISSPTRPPVQQAEHSPFPTFEE